MADIVALTAMLSESEDGLESRDRRNVEMKAQVRELKQTLAQRLSENRSLKRDVLAYRNRHDALIASFSWRMTGPIRWIVRLVARRKD